MNDVKQPRGQNLREIVARHVAPEALQTVSVWEPSQHSTYATVVFRDEVNLLGDLMADVQRNWDHGLGGHDRRYSMIEFLVSIFPGHQQVVTLRIMAEETGC